MVVFALAYVLMLMGLHVYGKQEDCIEECEYIMVLGAKLHQNTPSAPLKRRLLKVVELSQISDAKIIVSGGSTSEGKCSEAKAMKWYLEVWGVDPTRILVEDKSTSTYTNFLFTRILLGNKGANIALVTCDFHMYRACKMAKQLGFTCSRHPSMSKGIRSCRDYTRECLCLCKYMVLKK